jgi:prophage DNA circulation protein
MSAAPPINPIGTISQAPVDQSNTSWLAGTWWQQLMPGSWRGVAFVMDTTPTKAGRRIAVHEYPYRDTVWPEDLGRLPRRYQVSAFLVGDDVYQQKRAMIAACEQAGVGTLVHPTLGAVQCVLLDFATTDRRDRGRYVEVELDFIDASSTALSPASSSATGEAVNSFADALDTTSISALGINLQGLQPLAAAATRFVPSFAQITVDAVNDPARALNAVAGLPGLFGRYSTGSRLTLLPSTATVSSALAAAVNTRQTVLDAANALTAAAAGL